MSSYLYITHPKNFNRFSIFSDQGKKMIQKYFYQSGGGDDITLPIHFDSSLTPSNPIIKKKIPCFLAPINQDQLENQWHTICKENLDQTNSNINNGNFFYSFENGKYIFPLQITLPPFPQFFSSDILKKFWTIKIHEFYQIDSQSNHDLKIPISDNIFESESVIEDIIIIYVEYFPEGKPDDQLLTLNQMCEKQWCVKYENFLQFMNKYNKTHPSVQYILHSFKEKPQLDSEFILDLASTNLISQKTVSFKDLYNIIIFFNIIYGIPFNLENRKLYLNDPPELKFNNRKAKTTISTSIICHTNFSPYGSEPPGNRPAGLNIKTNTMDAINHTNLNNNYGFFSILKMDCCEINNNTKNCPKKNFFMKMD